jgi:hypothetical protein
MLTACGGAVLDCESPRGECTKVVKVLKYTLMGMVAYYVRMFVGLFVVLGALWVLMHIVQTVPLVS